MRALVVVLFAAAVGCGPVTYVQETTIHAQSAVDAARAAGAEKLAPYPYTRAVQYLELSRWDASRADWQGANHFGALARQAADQAVLDAAKAEAAARPARPRGPEIPAVLAPKPAPTPTPTPEVSP